MCYLLSFKITAMNVSVLTSAQSMAVYWYEIGLYCEQTSSASVIAGPQTAAFIFIFSSFKGSNLSAIWGPHHLAPGNKQGWWKQSDPGQRPPYKPQSSAGVWRARPPLSLSVSIHITFSFIVPTVKLIPTTSAAAAAINKFSLSANMIYIFMIKNKMFSLTTGRCTD